MSSSGRRSTLGDDNVYLQTDEVGRKGGETIVHSLRPPRFDDKALTFHIAQLAERLAKGFETALSSLIRTGAPGQIAYPGRILLTLSRSGAD